MSTMKDKLTSSVRKAKTRSTQQSKSENEIADKQSGAQSTATNINDKPTAIKRKTVSAGGIPESSGELFPDRVWPD